jgi:hypothetical protein
MVAEMGHWVIPGGAFVPHFRDSLSTESCAMDLISVLHVFVVIIIIIISPYIYF